jgi:hypothetical protein
MEIDKIFYHRSFQRPIGDREIEDSIYYFFEERCGLRKGDVGLFDQINRRFDLLYSSGFGVMLGENEKPRDSPGFGEQNGRLST